MAYTTWFGVCRGGVVLIVPNCFQLDIPYGPLYLVALSVVVDVLACGMPSLVPIDTGRGALPP